MEYLNVCIDFIIIIILKDTSTMLIYKKSVPIFTGASFFWLTYELPVVDLFQIAPYS
jgi:hypothetical protein